MHHSQEGKKILKDYFSYEDKKCKYIPDMSLQEWKENRKLANSILIFLLVPIQENIEFEIPPWRKQKK